VLDCIGYLVHERTYLLYTEWQPSFYKNSLTPGWIYISGGPEAIKMWRPLSITNLGYYFFFLLISYNNYKYKLTSRDFREANVSMKSVYFISVL
jgi:hypothetical protein